ncbi:hypothetical protein PFICI_12139 [Pestalotiopsis fici W106-1]|uniref:Alkaline ceramidase 3 n=1 Tax=Pestalotiopsis fici (strain W106-1 / CGMCC3.15140) TaxID=1229662 RepID=W3WUG7_PESFW|nr:uncharacterized protein PFICI_12139 [Pestalotiopsis fici W106-1]ETS76752.1 hypothetical protein PFICI_12139 [Pestalotiopsis fici W106-1]
MGHHNRHFAGDAHVGIWGPPTSAANFCEEDYAVTRFIAEFMNTLSNLAYVYFAFKYPGRSTQETSTISRLDSLSWGLLLVGLASGAFHATLRQGPQFADDLSMLFLTGIMMQYIYCQNQPAGLSRVIAAAVWFSVASASLVYVHSGDIIIHMSAFGASVALIGVRLLQLIYRRQRPEQETAELAARFWTGAAYLAAAFAVWNADLELCVPLLRAQRQRVGWPWALALELHGWWHVLTAAGAAQMIQLVRSLCNNDQNGRKCQPNKEGSRRQRASPPSSALHRGILPKESQADLERIGSSR